MLEYSSYGTGIPSEVKSDTTTGKRFFVCQQCNHINVIEEYENAKKRKTMKWQMLTKRNVKYLFKLLAAGLDMTYEETLVYLMKLHEKESHQMYNSINVAGVGNNQEESSRK